ASIDQLTNAAASNVRFTPPLFIQATDVLQPPDAACKVVNVTSEVRHIKVEVFGVNGLIVGGLVEAIDPGHQTGLDVGISPNDAVFCKFTVVDGTRSDIRADLAVSFFNVQGRSNVVTIPAE